MNMETVYLNFILAALGLALAVVSIAGETWRKGSERWYTYLTRRGWVSVGLLIAICSVTMLKDLVQHHAEAVLEARILKISNSSDSILTSEEFDLVNIGTSVDFLIERLGQPKVDLPDENVVCSGSVRYMRWSDVGRDFIQVLADDSGRVIGFGLSSKKHPMEFVNVSVLSEQRWEPNQDRMGIFIFEGFRFFGFVDFLGQDARSHGRKVYVGWSGGAPHIETLKALEAGSEPAALEKRELRELMETLGPPKLNIFSELPLGECLDEEPGDELGAPEGKTAVSAHTSLVFFSFADFENYEWFNLGFRS